MLRWSPRRNHWPRSPAISPSPPISTIRDLIEST
jgi:hypothetical protein